MVAPVVESTASGNTGSNTSATTHSPSYPTGVASGNLVYLHAVSDGQPTITISDFTQQDVQDNSNNSARAYIGYREADGTEGSTFTISTSVSEHVSWSIFRNSGAEDPDTQAPETAFFQSSGNVTSIDCPTVTPTGGSKDYQVLTFCGFDTGNQSITAFPYANNNIDGGGGNTGNDVTNGASNDAVTSATINPGSFTISANRPGVAYTVVIHPASGGGTTVNATTDNLTLTDYQASISLDKTVSATVDSLALTDYAAAVSLNIDVSASSDVLTITDYPAAITLDANISATTDSLTITDYPATIGGGVEVAATTDNLTLTDYPASVDLSANIQASVDSLTITDYQAQIFTGTLVEATTDSLTLTDYPASIQKDANIQASADVLSITDYPATISNGEINGAGSKKKKREEDYRRAFQSAKRRKDQREAIQAAIQAEQEVKSKSAKPVLRLKKKALKEAVSNSEIQRLSRIQSEIDQQIAIEFLINELEFKRREDEALALLLLIA